MDDLSAHHHQFYVDSIDKLESEVLTELREDISGLQSDIQALGQQIQSKEEDIQSTLDNPNLKI